MVKKAGKATMEHYISFHENPKEPDLTKDQLNQILVIHGFGKLHHSLRKDVIDSVYSIDPLMTPYRSTLKENTSSSANLPLPQVIDDLSILEWNECSVKSLQTIGLIQDKVSTLSPPAAVSFSNKRKRTNFKKLSALAAAAASASATTFTPPDSSSVSTLIIGGKI